MSKKDPDFTAVRVKIATKIDLEGFKEYPEQPLWKVVDSLIAFKRAHADCAKEVEHEKTDNPAERPSAERPGGDSGSGQAGNEGASG